MLLQRWAIEIRNARKSFLLHEELKYEELRNTKWIKAKNLIESEELPSKEKKKLEEQLFNEIVLADEELIKINDELLIIERQEADERRQEALKNIITIDDEEEEIQEIVIIDLTD